MKNKTKIMIGIFLVSSIIALTCISVIDPVVSNPPLDDDPDDPGNTNGPGFYDSVPPVAEKFEFLREDFSVPLTGIHNL